MSFGDYVILGIVAIWFVGAVWFLIRCHRQGKSACGCGGGCNACSGCSGGCSEGKSGGCSDGKGGGCSGGKDGGCSDGKDGGHCRVTEKTEQK